MRYSNLQEQDSALAKIRRSSYLIVSISILTHTFSLIYSLITFRKESAAFISIIVSSLTCFFISSSHLTIYGISVLGTLYISMIQPYYSSYQIFYTVALSGVIMFAFWRFIHSLGTIFHCLPSRIHASLVFGIVLIVLARFFPLAIQNTEAFFRMASQSSLTSPFDILQQIFKSFNVLTLVLTIVCLIILFLIRGKLEKIPLIGIMVILGVLINYGHQFKSFTDLCQMQNVDCEFKIVDSKNLKTPELSQIIEIIPSAIILTIVLIFQQFLYLEEFQRRGRRFHNTGNLGEIKTQTKTLAIANLISGLLGGLPICINIFGTYQNFSFNKKYGFQGTKWVGVLQIPFSFLLYSIFDGLFTQIPMFVLFILVATPVIYFIKNVLMYNYKNLPTIIFIAIISLISHPIVALIIACFISIYQISELLRPAPAEMMIQKRESSRASILSNVPQKKLIENNQLVNDFVNRIIEIDEDVPDDLISQKYLLYRFIGSVSFLNFYQHLEEINKSIQKYCKEEKDPYLLILSMRYSQCIDNQSLNELAFLTQQLIKDGIRMIFTGLHEKIMKQMQQIAYFSLLLREEEKCMYRINMSGS